MMKNSASGNREPQPNNDFSESSYEYSDESDGDRAAASPQPAAAAANANAKSNRVPARDLDRTASATAAGGEDQGDGDKPEKKGIKKWARRIPNPAAKVRSVAVALSGPDSQRITLYIFLLVGLLHLLFVILACVLSQLDERGGGCYTYWGYKTNCDSTSYTTRASLMSDCPKRRSMLQAGAAFSILSILTSLAVVIVGWILCSRMRHVIRQNRRRARYNRHLEGDRLTDTPAANTSATGSTSKRTPQGTQFQPGMLKWTALGIVCTSLSCELICWAIIAGLYSLRPCELTGKRELTYGVGFGLGLTAWIILLILTVCFVILV